MAPPILVAVDPADCDRSPVWTAVTLARITRAQVVLAGVYASDGTVNRLSGGEFGEELPESASDVLEQLAAEVVREGADADVASLAAASAPRAIDLAIQELGAGLVVVGSSAATRGGRVMLGQVGTRLVDGARCPVLVTPRNWLERPPALRTVGVGFVGLAEGRAAVRDADALARAAGATLRVFSVVRRRPWMAGERDDVEADLRDRAASAAESHLAALSRSRVDVEILVGEAADVLREVSAELDLLVCGARSYGAQPATLLGDVGRSLLAGASCAVLLEARGGESGMAASLPGTGD